jgi:arginase
MQKHVDLIGYASGAGAQNVGCEDGSLYCQQHHLECVIQSMGMDVSWRAQVQAEERGMRGNELDILSLCKALSEQVEGAIAEGRFPVTIGGDHSMAIGTWHGVAAAKQAQGRLGLLWVDAHMDAHTLSSSQSGNIHGMPVGYLLGYGEGKIHQFLGEVPIVSVPHTVIFGIRSFEPEEEMLLKRLGVKVYCMKDIKERGLQTCWEEALAKASGASGGFGVSFDIDVLDPVDVPGTGTIEPDGILANDMLPLLEGLKQCPGLAALEIAEFNPHLDQDHKTYTVIQNILKCAL